MDFFKSSKINSCNQNQINSSLHNSFIGKYDPNLKMEKCAIKKCFKNLNHEQTHYTDVLKSFNFHEKERYRQLISLSSFPNKDSFPLSNMSVSLSNSSNLNSSENPYLKYIYTKPNQIFDDISLSSPGSSKLRNFSRRPSLLSENVNHKL
jgi:hypothetical protein